LQRLEALAETALESSEGSIDVAQAEGALRAWAAVDDVARRRVQEIDDLRLKHVATELRGLGADAETARRGAKVIYLTLLGLYTARRYTPEIADDEAFRYVVRQMLDDSKTNARRPP
jgi:hypothetical protein